MKRPAFLSILLAAVMLFSACDHTASQTDSFSDTEDVTESTAAETEIDEDSIYVNPKYSVKGGIVAPGTSLSVTLPENAPEGAYITFTLDGNEPGKNSDRWEGDITLDGECVIVRTACFSSDGVQLGRIKTNTYFTDSRYSTYVVSLVTDEDNLYGKDGIIDNYSLSGKEGERPCHVEIFTSDGTEVISQDAGIRIFGGSSRSLSQKSFRLVARKDGYYDEVKYNGSGSFDAPLFDGRTVEAGENKGSLLERYDRFILRNGGNDSLHSTAADPKNMTLTRDAVANYTMHKYAPGVAWQASRFVTVYLNGEYYGILDMKEDINDDYMRNVYGLEKDHVTVIKSELDTTRNCKNHSNGASCRFCDVWFYYEVDDGPESELDEWQALCDKAALAMSKGEAEQAKAYKEISALLDTESFMAYAAVSLYCCNTDWPHNNVRLWRYTGDKIEGNEFSDGKWRFSTRDMDFCFGRYEAHILPDIYSVAEADTLFYTLGNYINGKYSVQSGNYPDSLGLQGLLALCLTDDGFRADFEELCKTLASESTAKYLKGIMSDFADSIENEIPYHIDRWSQKIRSSNKDWIKATNSMSKWTKERPEYFLSDLDDILKYFD